MAPHDFACPRTMARSQPMTRPAKPRDFRASESDPPIRPVPMMVSWRTDAIKTYFVRLTVIGYGRRFRFGGRRGVCRRIILETIPWSAAEAF